MREADGYARDLAEASQAVAQEHLGRAARVRYWQHVLDAYASLYRGGERTV